jgi:DNA polymerase-3 subunit gamma/tau
LSGQISGEKSTAPGKVEEPAPESVQQKEQKNETPFTEDELLKVWKGFIDTLEKPNPRLHSILHNHPPKLKENNVIEIAVLGTQVNEIEQSKKMVLDELRSKLKNDLIVLKVEVLKRTEAPRKVFTAADRFKQMAEKNPALLDMTKKLGLDLD